jgi:hypothetical protein
MTQSESVKTILSDLGKAQAEFPTLPKDSNGYNYKYTNLDTVISTLRPILSKHNIGFMQSLTTLENNKAAMTTRLFHTTGEWLEDTTPLPDVLLSKGNAAQNMGAAITYMKRYTLCAMLGVSCDEDPDGKADGNPDFNARKQNNGPAPKQNNTPAGGWDTPEQGKRIKELLGSKYPDGTQIFTDSDHRAITSMRAQKTADEVIRMLNEEVTKATNEWNAKQNASA